MIVVNFSTLAFQKAQSRLSESLGNHAKLMLKNYHDIGSPTHQESPYQFKIHAIEKAWQSDPVVLWVDSSMYLRGNLGDIEQIILSDGYFMEEAGHYVKDWCNEHTLGYFKIPRNNPYLMFSAGLLGLDKRNALAMQFFEQWKQSALSGCFRGDWKDHRHDMTCGSIIASQLGMKYQRGGSHLSYIGPGYSAPEAGTVFYCQGML